MGGFFGITSKKECVQDVFFGIDYHSHLGNSRAGMASVNSELGFQREIHNVENSPFRTKFDNITARLKGCACVGCISDLEPQPLLIRSKFGTYAITMVGYIANSEKLANEYLKGGYGIFQAVSGNRVNSIELVSALIEEKESVAEGIKHVQNVIEGSASIMLLFEDGSLIIARDKFGRLPIKVGKNNDGYAVSFESFAYEKLGYVDCKELKSGEIVKLTPDSMEVLEKGNDKMKICSFLWAYYGYPNATYEGRNVEVFRMDNGRIMAENEIKNGTLPEIDYVSGVPDSGTPHAIGYSHGSGIPFARPFIKYTPAWARSFIPSNQSERKKVAKMKQIPVIDLIKGKNLLFVDDSIVRGTQLGETVSFLFNNGAKSVHMRSACPPIMYACKYLNFSRNNSDMDLLARRIIVELEGEEGLNYIDEYADFKTERGKSLRKAICKKMKINSLEFQTLDGLLKAIKIDPCKLCTYCWNGKED